MATTYTTSPPRLYLGDGQKAADFAARTVFEPEPEVIKTTLLDARGTPIYRVKQMDPIGFIHLKERK